MRLLRIINSIFNKNGDENSRKTVNVAVVLLFLAMVLIGFSSISSKPKTENIKDSENSITDVRDTEEKRLKKELLKVSGVKDVSVLISYIHSGTDEAMTEEKTVLKNQKNGGEGESVETQREIKPIYDGDKNIIKKTEYMPEIKGVCIFYSGVQSKTVEDKLYRAVKGALGIELHKIEVIHTKE